MCDEIIEAPKTIPTKAVPTKFVLMKSTSTNLSILLAFLF